VIAKIRKNRSRNRHLPRCAYQDRVPVSRLACGELCGNASTGTDAVFDHHSRAGILLKFLYNESREEIISAAGGEPKSLTRPEPAKGEADHLFPFVLPNGRGVLFTISTKGQGAENPEIAALDLKTGAMRWTRQMAPSTPDVFGCTPGDVNCGERAGPDFDFGASPVLARLPGGHQLVIAGQKSGVVYALDPDRKGEQVWHYRAGGGSGLGGIQWGIAADSERVYIPVAEIYSPTPGGLHSVELATGARAWYAPPEVPACGKPSRACSGAQFSAVTVIPGVVFSPSNDGEVRGYSTRDGHVVWKFDTNREFPTINGLRAKGGSMNGPPVSARTRRSRPRQRRPCANACECPRQARSLPSSSS
jgi:outer membrane protein assembly factor BamB